MPRISDLSSLIKCGTELSSITFVLHERNPALQAASVRRRELLARAAGCDGTRGKDLCEGSKKSILPGSRRVRQLPAEGPLLLLFALGMRGLRLFARHFRLLLGFGGMLLTLGMVILAMRLGSDTMGLCRR